MLFVILSCAVFNAESTLMIFLHWLSIWDRSVRPFAGLSHARRHFAIVTRDQAVQVFVHMAMLSIALVVPGR